MALRTQTTQATLTTTAVAQITAGANDAYTIVKALVHNADTTTRTLVMNLATGGAAAGATNQIIAGTGAGIALSAGETKTLPLSGVAIVNSGKLYAKVGEADTTSAVTLTITYNKTDQAA